MTEMLTAQNISFSANAFSHYNPVLQMVKEKKRYSKEIQDIMREDSCRQMNFEQFFKITKYEGEIPQLMEDLFKYLTTMSLKDFLRRVNGSLGNVTGS